MRDPFDRSSKWLIDHRGGSILRLGGGLGVRSWRSVQADIVQPRRLPDGLLEGVLEGGTEPSPCLIEIATYPHRRVTEQVAGNMLLVLLDRGVLPDVLTLVLRPHGNVRVEGAYAVTSRHGLAEFQSRWRVVELWTVAAEDLLASDDVGLIPWVPLTHFDGPPEVLLHECRRRLDQLAPAAEYANLLAVTQVMARLQYNDPNLLAIIGGRQIMIESPLIQELMAEKTHEVLLEVLEARCGSVPAELAARLRTVIDEEKL